MNNFRSRLDKRSDAFADNRREMLGLLDNLGVLRERSAALSERRRARFEERGQLTLGR